jgi:uncharacterized protein YkwD
MMEESSTSDAAKKAPLTRKQVTVIAAIAAAAVLLVAFILFWALSSRIDPDPPAAPEEPIVATEIEPLAVDMEVYDVPKHGIQVRYQADAKGEVVIDPKTGATAVNSIGVLPVDYAEIPESISSKDFVSAGVYNPSPQTVAAPATTPTNPAVYTPGSIKPQYAVFSPEARAELIQVRQQMMTLFRNDNEVRIAYGLEPRLWGDTIYSELSTHVVLTEDDLRALAREVIDVWNEIRAQPWPELGYPDGMPAVTWSETLGNIFQITRGPESAERFSHDRPDGRSCLTALSDYGLPVERVDIGEVLTGGWTTAAEMVDSLLRSDNHRPFMLNPNIQWTGAGIGIDENSVLSLAIGGYGSSYRPVESPDITVPPESIRPKESDPEDEVVDVVIDIDFNLNPGNDNGDVVIVIPGKLVDDPAGHWDISIPVDLTDAPDDITIADPIDGKFIIAYGPDGRPVSVIPIIDEDNDGTPDGAILDILPPIEGVEVDDEDVVEVINPEPIVNLPIVGVTDETVERVLDEIKAATDAGDFDGADEKADNFLDLIKEIPVEVAPVEEVRVKVDEAKAETAEARAAAESEGDNTGGGGGGTTPTTPNEPTQPTQPTDPGPQEVAIPNVVGMGLADATDLIIVAGFSVGTECLNPTVDRGDGTTTRPVVVSTSPSGSALPGSHILVYYRYEKI